MRRRARAAPRSRCGSTRRIRARSSRRPAASSGCGCPRPIRVDAGVAEGDEVGTAYDPMIAKLIAHGATREEALDRLAAALAETEVERRDDEPAVPALARRPPGAARRRDDDRVPRRATRRSRRRRRRSRTHVWRGAFRLNLPSPATAGAAPTSTPRRTRTAPAAASSTITAPMPGHGDPASTFTKAQQSRRGDPLVVLEAMKMETPLLAPYDADGRAVHVAGR